MNVEYSDFVVPLLRSLRPEIMEYFGKIRHDLKSDNSVVTEVDKKIETMLVAALEEEYPEIGFCGEEFGRKGSTEKYWLIDPIDGTENFIRGIAQIGTIVGLVEHGKIVFAAIYDPIIDNVYHASLGAGSWKDKQRISVSDRAIDRSMVEVDCMRDPELHKELLVLLDDQKCAQLQVHGAAWRACIIAEGKIEGMVRFAGKGSTWDYAPGNFIMREAGAVIRYFDGKDELQSRSFSALSPKVDSRIGDLLEKLILKAEEA